MSNFKKYSIFVNPLYWPVWFCISLLWCTIYLPISMRLFLGRRIGQLIYACPSKLKHITLTNIKLCFPELSLAEQTLLAKKNFASLGIGLIETAMAWGLPTKKSYPLTIRGKEYLEEALAKKQGIILLSPHFTSLEIVGKLLSATYPLAVMYRPHKNPLLAFMQEHFRKNYYHQTIPHHRMRQLLRALQANTIIWYAYDVDAGIKHSVFAAFFGTLTASLTSVSRLKQLTNATIIPVSFFRHENTFGYEVIFYPPIQPFPTGDLQQDATQLNAALEVSIREKPEQYIWQYKRFKTRPPGEKRIY